MLYNEPNYRDSMNWTRRHFLATCPAIMGVAGCQNVLSTKPEARIAWLWFVNDRQQPVSANLTIQDDGETVYESEIALDGPDSARFTPPPTVIGGYYSVEVATDDRLLRVATWDFVDRNNPCIGLRFMFLNNGEFDWTHRTMQHCDSSGKAEVSP